MKMFAFSIVMCVLCMSGYAEGEIIFNPEGRLKDFYVREWSQVSNRVNRFVKDHNCRKKVLKEKIKMSPYSMIWHEPALTKSEFASVFWNTNTVILVTSAYWTKDECVVKMYDLKSSLRNMIGEIVDSLEKYDYALSVNGDGNTSLFGFVHEDESCVNKCFSIQIGSAYKHAKQKMFCATADSLKAYQYMSKVRDFLKMLMFNSPIESYNVCSSSLLGWREVGSGKLTR